MATINQTPEEPNETHSEQMRRYESINDMEEEEGLYDDLDEYDSEYDDDEDDY